LGGSIPSARFWAYSLLNDGISRGGLGSSKMLSLCACLLVPFWVFVGSLETCGVLWRPFSLSKRHRLVIRLLFKLAFWKGSLVAVWVQCLLLGALEWIIYLGADFFSSAEGEGRGGRSTWNHVGCFSNFFQGRWCAFRDPSRLPWDLKTSERNAQGPMLGSLPELCGLQVTRTCWRGPSAAAQHLRQSS